MASNDFSQINALDPNTLGGLRRLSKQNTPEAAKEAAKQFEALFVQQLLKSMRIPISVVSFAVWVIFLKRNPIYIKDMRSAGEMTMPGFLHFPD